MNEDHALRAGGEDSSSLSRVKRFVIEKKLHILVLLMLLALAIQVFFSTIIKTSVADLAYRIHVVLSEPSEEESDSVEARSQLLVKTLRKRVREEDSAGDARIYFDTEDCLQRKTGWAPSAQMTREAVAGHYQRECALEVIGLSFIDAQGGSARRAARAADLLSASGFKFAPARTAKPDAHPARPSSCRHRR